MRSDFFLTTLSYNNTPQYPIVSNSDTLNIVFFIYTLLGFYEVVVNNFKGMNYTGTIVINGENIRLFFIMTLPILWVFIYNLPEEEKE